MNYYITPEEYEEARRNGIPDSTVYVRVYVSGWDVERAITTPVQVQKRFKSKWLDTALANGIPRDVFRGRVRYEGWDEERAATTPVISKQEAGKRGAVAKNTKYARFTSEELATLEKNGISRGTAISRLNTYGWSMEKTINTPVRGRKKNANNRD